MPKPKNPSSGLVPRRSVMRFTPAPPSSTLASKRSWLPAEAWKPRR